jgi:hypothetical protein
MLSIIVLFILFLDYYKSILYSMKMQFSDKNRVVRKSETIKHTSVINETVKQPVYSFQRRNYDMISIANSGSKCNFCNR